MSNIWTMGEVLVEIMRPEADMQLFENGVFCGPFPSGAPAIFIDTVARLGISAGIIGGVGRDDFSKCILDRLKGDGVNCDNVLCLNSGSTAAAFVTYFKSGERKFIFHIGGTPATMAKCPAQDSIGTPKFLHLMGCSLMVDGAFYDEIIKTVKLFISMGAKISFDPNIRPELLQGRNVQEIVAPVIENCSVLLPGLDELLLISGEAKLEDAVEKMFRNPKLEIIALKTGKKGCTIYTRETRFNFGVYNIIPKDATGAGDTFDGAFLSGLLLGKDLLECTKIATAAASLNTAAFGPMEGNINSETVHALISNEQINPEYF